MIHHRSMLVAAVLLLLVPVICLRWPDIDWNTGVAWRLNERVMVSARYDQTGIQFAKVVRDVPVAPPSPPWLPPDRFWYPTCPDNGFVEDSQSIFLGYGVSSTQYFDCVGCRVGRVAYAPSSAFRRFEGLVSFGTVRVPFWPLWIPGTLLLLLFTWKEGSRRRQAERGFCGHCGYDLRASKGRCPECGMLIPAEVKP